MPNRLILEVGADIIVLPLKGTVAQIRAAVRRYAITKGIATEGRTTVEIGTDVLASLKKTVADGSLDRHRAELLSEQSAAMNAVLDSDNDL